MRRVHCPFCVSRYPLWGGEDGGGVRENKPGEAGGFHLPDTTQSFEPSREVSPPATVRCRILYMRWAVRNL